MSARYEMRDVGVFDRQTETLIMPGTREFEAYRIATMSGAEQVDPAPEKAPRQRAPEDLAAIADEEATRNLRAQLLGDNVIRALRDFTLADLATYIENNVADSGTRRVLKRLGAVVLLMARERLREA